MPFGYYERLSAPEKAVYRLSDQVRAIRLYRPFELTPLVERVRAALADGKPDPIAAAVAELAGRITDRLEVPPVEIAVLEVRPRTVGAELHGLYTRQPDQLPLICLWMRTAVHGRVVAFRTFLRTLLHELCHHLDVELIGLPVSFHTEGFYKRETSLFYQLVPRAPRPPKQHS